MQLLYFTNEKIPSSSACTIQQVNMCEAFANLGMHVSLVRPYFYDSVHQQKQDIYDFYGVENVFDIISIPSLLNLSKFDLDALGIKKARIPYVGGASTLLATSGFIKIGLLRGLFNHETVIYSRNVNAAIVFLQHKKMWLRNKPVRIVFEVHSYQQQPQSFFDRVLRDSDYIVTISHALKHTLRKTHSIDPKKIHVFPDGVRREKLVNSRFCKQEARERLNLDKAYKNVILYTGQILPGKGVEHFVHAASYFDENTLFLVDGGPMDNIWELKKEIRIQKPNNVKFSGFVSPKCVSLYQDAADVVVLPNTDGSAICHYTSPLKLFEYMASSRPIIASDMPVLREILRHNENAVLVPPADAHSLSNAIKNVLADKELAQRVAGNARKEVESFTWDKRAANIIDFVSNNNVRKA